VTLRNSGRPLRWAVVTAVTLLLIVPLRASDHADPIDIFNRKPLEGGITDLFVFPDSDGKQLVVLLCVRRALTQTGSLRLEPYTYSIYMDLDSHVSHSHEQQRFRYGGTVDKPEAIDADVTMTFRLKNDATVSTHPTIGGRAFNVPAERIKVWPGRVGQEPRIDPTLVNVWTGIADDPFIFPVFFKTNVVAMVVSLPMSLFREDQQDWIVWADSHRDGKRVDHVGRSLRTQNPRFELLNTLHPREHVAAIKEEHEHPSLMRDIFVRIGINSIFAYRTWDQVPDVMLFTRRKGISFSDDEPPSDGNARFPNGRRLEDDVAERLARYGDPLLKEISYIAGGWPRATKNDNGELQPTGKSTAPRTVFPYLADPWPDREPKEPYMLSGRNQIKLALIVIVVLGIPAFLGWFIAYLHYRRRFRLRYL